MITFFKFLIFALNFEFYCPRKSKPRKGPENALSAGAGTTCRCPWRTPHRMKFCEVVRKTCSPNIYTLYYYIYVNRLGRERTPCPTMMNGATLEILIQVKCMLYARACRLFSMCWKTDRGGCIGRGSKTSVDSDTRETQHGLVLYIIHNRLKYPADIQAHATCDYLYVSFVYFNFCILY